MDDYKGCEYCRLYDVINGFMFCKHLKKRITARKKPCNKYDDIRNENK